eukprot:gene24627-30995_t
MLTSASSTTTQQSDFSDYDAVRVQSADTLYSPRGHSSMSQFNQTSTTVTTHSNLRQISNQNHLAATQIQALFRAHVVRLRVWKYGGVLMVSRVRKIQRVFRGFLGRQKAAAAYKRKVLRSAHTIQGLYYTWHSKRQKLIAHLKFLNRAIIRFQSQFRRRKATQLVRIIRLHSLHTADTSSSLVYSNLTSRNTSRNVTRQNTSEEVHAYVLGEGEGEEGDVLGYGMGLGNSNNPHNNLTINNTNSASSTPPSSSYNTSSYSVYMSLMALWTRTGKIKAVRVDFLEEAVAIQLQSFLLTRYRNIEKSRKEVEDEVNQADELKLHKITPIEQIRAVYLKESEMRTRYRIRSLLRRAQALLSPNSLDMREIVLKQEVYDNLWSKEECYVLVEKSDVLYPFRAVIPVVEAPVKPSTPKVNTPKSLRNKNTPQPAPPIPVKPPLTAEQLDQINQTTSSKQLAANEVQVLQCGRMVLVTGYVSCERLVDAYYGVESPSNSIHSSTYSMTYDSFLKQQQTPQTPTVNAPPVASPSILKQQKSVKNVEEASTANGTEDTLQPLPSLTAPNSTHSNSNSNSNTPKEPVKIKSLGDFMRRTSVAETTGIMRRRSVEFSTAQFQPENLLPFEPEPVAPPPVQQAVSTDSLTQCTSLPIQIRPLVLFISEIEYIAKLHSLYTEHKNLSTTQHNDDKLDLIGDASYSHVNTIDYQKIKHVRHLRGNNARLIQCVFRGFRWRKELKRLNLQALIIQCAFRVFRAVNKVNAERVRRDGGPQVFEMIKGGRGLCIENLRFTLQIFRCGHNYRLQGTNLIEGVVYDGYVHQQDVWRLISERNSTIQGSSLASKQARIQMWQYERVIELIIVNLGFNTMIASVTSKLGGGK